MLHLFALQCSRNVHDFFRETAPLLWFYSAIILIIHGMVFQFYFIVLIVTSSSFTLATQSAQAASRSLQFGCSNMSKHSTFIKTCKNKSRMIPKQIKLKHGLKGITIKSCANMFNSHCYNASL